MQNLKLTSDNSTETHSIPVETLSHPGINGRHLKTPAPGSGQKIKQLLQDQLIPELLKLVGQVTPQLPPPMRMLLRSFPLDSLSEKVPDVSDEQAHKLALFCNKMVYELNQIVYGESE